MPVFVQDVIHKYELGAGSRILKIIVGMVAVVALALLYDMAAFRNLSSAEAMDTAQLARNISQGKGFTTDFIRPFSLYLLARHSNATNVSPDLIERSPDISNPPAYPALLAGVFKVMPQPAPDLADVRSFSTYAPELWIAGFNQLLLLLCACLVFSLARQLFDEPVAWASAAVFVATELFWRHSVSGLPTLWLSFLVLLASLLLVRLDRLTREPSTSQGWAVPLALVIGLLTALAGLTRYALLAFIVPVVLYLATLPSQRRALLAIAAVFGFLALVGPWLFRNYSLTGTLFGTAGYSALAGTSLFPDDTLMRSLSPDFSTVTADTISRKILANLRHIFVHELPTLGGGWVATALFLAGLFVPFRNLVNRRWRMFVLALVGILLISDAAVSPLPSAETHMASDYLAVAGPLLFILGISLLFNLLEQFAGVAMRYSVIGLFFLLSCAPFILSFLTLPYSPVAFPPYYPPSIQAKAAYTPAGEWMMSSMPWAVAWYGNSKAVPLSVKHGSAETAGYNDFYSLHRLKPIRGLHIGVDALSEFDGSALARWRQSEAMDKDWELFRTRVKAIADAVESGAQKQPVVDALMEAYSLADKHWVRGGGTDWQSFLLGILVTHEVPTGFPLKMAPEGLMPEIFLTDSERPSQKRIQSSKQAQSP
jgi:hypothetical protein